MKYHIKMEPTTESWIPIIGDDMLPDTIRLDFLEYEQQQIWSRLRRIECWILKQDPQADVYNIEQKIEVSYITEAEEKPF